MNGSTPPTYVCPRCRTELTASPSGLFCSSCAHAYPIVEGIPDLRVAPDPWIGIEDDRAKAGRVVERIRGLDFEASVRAYWALTPSTPPRLAARFVDHVMRARDRTRQWLDHLGEDTRGDGSRWLDEGCGTADLAAAAGPSADVVGVDVALRWLVIARRRLEEEGLPARLVCANAEALPFPDLAFARVFSLGLIEHCADQGGVFREARRVLTRGGALRLRTVNRFSVLREPHVGLWGVGFLPRPWAKRYVGWRIGRPYEHHYPIGPRGLVEHLRAAGFEGARVSAAVMLPIELEGLGGWGRRLGPLYERLRRNPVARPGLTRLAPLLEAEAVA